MRRGFLRFAIVLSLAAAAFFARPPKAEAMDPITIAAIAAPIVIPMVQKAMPYVIKGAVNFAKGMFDVFIDMAGLFLLPLGMMESSFGAPFGLFGLGMSHMGRGAMAPLKMMWSTMLLPVKIFGFG